jgi:hypothetical protein
MRKSEISGMNPGSCNLEIPKVRIFYLLGDEMFWRGVPPWAECVGEPGTTCQKQKLSSF